MSSFLKNNNIQNIIQNKNIPYLKISKHSEHKESAEDNLLCIPIYDEFTLKNWVNIKLLHKTEIVQSELSQISDDEADDQLEIKEIDFFCSAFPSRQS